MGNQKRRIAWQERLYLQSKYHLGKLQIPTRPMRTATLLRGMRMDWPALNRKIL